MIIRFVFGRIQALKIPFNYHFKACSTAYQAVLSNIFYLISVIFNSAPKVRQYIVQMSKSVTMFIRFVFGRIQELKIPSNYRCKACSTAYQAVLSNIFYLITVIFNITPKVRQNIVQNIKMSKSVTTIICFVFGRIQGLKIPFNYHFKACSTAYQAVLSNIFYLISVIFNSAPKVRQNILQNIKMSKSVTMIICFVFGRIQALKIPFNYHFKACSTAYQAVFSNSFYLMSVIFNSAPKVQQYIVQMSKSVTMIICFVFGRIQALKTPFNYQFKACSTAYQAVLSNIFYLISVIFNSTPKVRQNIVQNVKMSKSVTMIIRFVFGRIQALKIRFNYHFKACSTAYQAVLSNIFYLISVIFNSTPKVRQNIVQNVKMSKSVTMIIRFVFGRIQALKIPFNYHFKACSTAYQAVLSNIFYLISVIFNSTPKVRQNIVQNVKMSKSVTMIIRFVFGRIQALKIPFNYHFKACSIAYQAVLSNIFYLISVIFNSAPKVRQNIVQNIKMSKSVTMIICFVVGRIQGLKIPFNYHFKACLTAYQAFLSNIFYLVSEIFNSAPKVHQYIVEMRKSVMIFFFALFSTELKS